MSSRATRQLTGDHQFILHALEVLREMCVGIERKQSVSRGDLQLLLQFFREFVHEYHDGKEELVLIPAFMQTGKSMHDGPLHRMVADHLEIHKAVAELESALAAENDAEFVRLAGRYSALLTNHIFSEDRFLFDAITEAFDEVTDRRAAKQLAEYEPGLRERSMAKFDQAVRALGRKYATPLCV